MKVSLIRKLGDVIDDQQRTIDALEEEVAILRDQPEMTLPLDDLAPNRLSCAKGEQVQISRVRERDGRIVTKVRKPARKGKRRPKA